MIKSLKDARIMDGLPRILSQEDWVRALSYAIGAVHEKTIQYADASQIYTKLDTASETILDALAANWKIDWYDTDYPEERKRRIVKTAMNVRKTMGTAYATRMQADMVYPGTQLEEWFDYGGKPGYFRLYIDITNSSPGDPIEANEPKEMERRLTAAKRWSAHLESLSYMVRRRIAVKRRVECYPCQPPECGAIRCGTHHTPSTLGWSVKKRAIGKTGVVAHLTQNPECGEIACGTYYTASSIGWSVHKTIEHTASMALYQNNPNLCGTLPESMAKGESIHASHVAKGKAEAFKGASYLCGQARCGEIP